MKLHINISFSEGYEFGLAESEVVVEGSTRYLESYCHSLSGLATVAYDGIGDAVKELRQRKQEKIRDGS